MTREAAVLGSSAACLAWGGAALTSVLSPHRPGQAHRQARPLEGSRSDTSTSGDRQAAQEFSCLVLAQNLCTLKGKWLFNASQRVRAGRAAAGEPQDCCTAPRFWASLTEGNSHQRIWFSFWSVVKTHLFLKPWAAHTHCYLRSMGKTWPSLASRMGLSIASAS